MTEIGPKFGYCPDPTKNWVVVVVKPCVSEKVESVFWNQNKDNWKSQRFGGSVGTRKFKDPYITTKVNERIGQLELLSKIAAPELQSTYCAFTAGFKHKVTYTMRTIPDIC